MVIALFLLFVQLQTRQITEHASHCRIDFKYPEIANADSFNAAVKQILNPLLKACREGGPPMPGEPNVGSYLDGDYTAHTLKTDMVTVLLKWGIYTQEAAHPGSSKASINYEPRTDKVLGLSDFFRPGVDYQSRLSQLAINSLKQQGNDHFAESEFVRHGDFKIFILTDTALVLYFPGGPAGTEYEAVIPLNALGSILRKRYLPPSPR